MTTAKRKPKMIRMTMRDGVTYEAKTAKGLVEKMRLAGIFTAGKDNVEYMAMVRRLAKTTHGATIRTTTEDDFVASLATEGMATVTTIH